jgi:hypothetical protein
MPDAVAQSITVWERFKPQFAIFVVLTGAAELVTAISQVVHWPLWALAATAPILATVVVATQTMSLRRTLLVGGFVALLIGGAFAVRQLEGPSQAPAAVHNHEVLGKRREALVSDLVGFAIRMLVEDGADVWGVAGASALLKFDGASLARLGQVRRFGGWIEHVTLCDGDVAVTYDDGMLAVFPDAGGSAARTVRYGRPLQDGSRTGLMACGVGSLYVAMPLEAQVLRFRMPSLRLVARISRVARQVTGLVYDYGALYVEDASQAAVITVRDDVPSAWTVTAQDPGTVLPMGSAGVLVAHTRSRCLGDVAPAHKQEIGLSWSAVTPLQVLAVAPPQGIALDTDGHLYRFDAASGSLDAVPLYLDAGEYASSVAITASGRVVLAVPSTDRLVSLPSTAWKPLHGQTEPASGCLTPSE